MIFIGVIWYIHGLSHIDDDMTLVSKAFCLNFWKSVQDQGTERDFSEFLIWDEHMFDFRLHFISKLKEITFVWLVGCMRTILYRIKHMTQWSFWFEIRNPNIDIWHLLLRMRRLSTLSTSQSERTATSYLPLRFDNPANCDNGDSHDNVTTIVLKRIKTSQAGFSTAACVGFPRVEHRALRTSTTAGSHNYMSQKKVGFRNVQIFLVPQVPDRIRIRKHKFLMKISKTHFFLILSQFIWLSTACGSPWETRWAYSFHPLCQVRSLTRIFLYICNFVMQHINLPSIVSGKVRSLLIICDIFDNNIFGTFVLVKFRQIPCDVFSYS